MKTKTPQHNVGMKTKTPQNNVREQELIRIRREMEETTLHNESQIAILRKKQQDAANEMADQIDQLNKARAR